MLDFRHHPAYLRMRPHQLKLPKNAVHEQASPRRRVLGQVFGLLVYLMHEAGSKMNEHTYRAVVPACGNQRLK